MSFDITADMYTTQLNHEATTQKEMDEAQKEMEVMGFRIEMALIKSAGGDEKKVGATEAARKRMYAMAYEDSPAYKTLRASYLDARVSHKYHQGMLRLAELKIKFIIAVQK